MSAWKMPQRLPEDGPCGVTRIGDDHLSLTVGPDGAHGSLLVSRYNASRLFAMLGMFLEIPLSKAIGKAIILTPPGKKMDVSFGFPEPKTLGERVAQALFIAECPDQIGDFVKVKEPVE